MTLRDMSNGRTSRTSNCWLAAALASLLVATPLCATAADSAASVAVTKAVTLEAIAGSPVKRVILSAKAAERLVQTIEQRQLFRPPTIGVHLGQFFGPGPAQSALQILQPALRPRRP